MTIYFNSDKARKHLLETKSVNTLRDHEISEELHNLATGSYRGKTTLFGVGKCEEIGEITNRDELKLYVCDSGFTTVDEWLAEAAKFGSRLPMFLHRVTLIKILEQRNY